jgi:hypothetical protein
LSNIFLIFLLEAYGVGGEALCFIMGSFPEMKSYSHCALHPCLQGRVYGALAGQIRLWAPSKKNGCPNKIGFFKSKKDIQTISSFQKAKFFNNPSSTM